jgi:hypothetical protein
MLFFVVRVGEKKINTVSSFKVNETNRNMTTYASENVNYNF